MRAAAWLRTPEFRNCYYDDAHFPDSLKFALEKELPKRQARESFQSVQHLGRQTPALRAQYQRLASEGEAWFAVPAIVNPAFASEPDTLLPCGVVVAPEQTREAILSSVFFASHAGSLYTGAGDARQYPGTARIMAKDDFRLFHREAFPVRETAGETFLYLSILLRKDWMPPDDAPFVPLLAMPGTSGAVMQIPWHVATGQRPAHGMIRPGRFAEIAVLDRQAERMVAEQYRGCGGMLRRCWHVFVVILHIFFWLTLAAGIIMVILGK